MAHPPITHHPSPTTTFPVVTFLMTRDAGDRSQLTCAAVSDTTKGAAGVSQSPSPSVSRSSSASSSAASRR